jgi:pimeloyl-ACP methyl ester carboxylesterase
MEGEEPRVERKISRLAWAVVAMVGVAATLAGCRNPPPTPSAGNLPIVFVHGIYGSGDQYRAMGQYFGSNGYPQERIRAFDYNSTANLGVGVPAALDQFINKAMRDFGTTKVQLVGHSLGTSVVNSYMGGAGHAAKIDKYVLVDGLTCSGAGSRPCLAISEFSLPATGGGTQTHVESTVSPESFAKQYNFFLGKDPATTRVVPESGQIKLAGRVQEFQANTPIANTQVEAWEVDPSTGHRLGGAPAATGRTDSDGFFGPINVTGGRPYDVTVVRPGASTFHCYYQPFVRSDYLLRLSTIGPNSAAAKNSFESGDAAAVTVVRNREFWRSKGQQNDELTLQTTTDDGRSQPPVDVFKNVTGNVVGVWIQDDDSSKGQSTLGLLSHFSSQPFQTGVDIFMPASAPPNGTISIVNTPRGDTSKKQTINTANWPSASDPILVEFNDWV